MEEARAHDEGRTARFESAGALMDELEKTASSKAPRHLGHMMTTRSSFRKVGSVCRARVAGDLHRLKEAMLLLVANDAPLEPEWLDHPLKRLGRPPRMPHRRRFLLIYQLDNNTVIFLRAGTRRSFGE